MSDRESIQNQENDNEFVTDEKVRREIQILSSRLYDLRERFMKVIHKINEDATDQISEEDDTTDEESIDDEDNDSTSISNDDEKSKVRLKIQKLVIGSILERKACYNDYIKHVVEYPKIMTYLLNDNPNCLNIPLHHLEPFIKDYVNSNPNGKIYDKIYHQIQDIRQTYLKNYQ